MPVEINQQSNYYLGMNYSFEYIDIILLAMIAGFIFLRLRGILGKRTGFEGKTPAQFKEVLKNIKVIYYLYNDGGELVGIDKTICSELKIKLESNEIKNITFYTFPEGKVHPEDKLDPNLKLLEGFVWRKSEKPESLDDLFK